MALYDNLPLNVRTKVDGDGVTFERWATRTANGGTVETVLIGQAAIEQANKQAVVDALNQAVTYFGGNYANWSTQTNAQKDAAAKNAQRALAQIAQWLLGKFDTAV